MNGWIKMHRKIINWEWYTDSKMVHFFVHLLLSANHEQGTWRGILIQRGQLITGINSLSESTGISAQSIRTCINRLKSTNEIQVQSTNKYSIITICNYDDYQYIENDTNKQTTSQLTNEQQTTNKQSTTNNNNNNLNNDKEINKFIKPEISEIIDYCKARKNTVDPNKFFNYYESNGWMVGRNKMKNWKAAIVTWETNNINQSIKNGSEPKKSRIEQAFEVHDAVLKMIDEQERQNTEQNG